MTGIPMVCCAAFLNKTYSNLSNVKGLPCFSQSRPRSSHLSWSCCSEFINVPPPSTQDDDPTGWLLLLFYPCWNCPFLLTGAKHTRICKLNGTLPVLAGTHVQLRRCCPDTGRYMSLPERPIKKDQVCKSDSEVQMNGH